MAKKKKIAIPPQAKGHFSPQALYLLKKKESELRLYSHSFCSNPYKSLDYSPFIYMEILDAMNKKFGGKYKPVKIFEKTITESSDYISKTRCVIYPILVSGEMFIFVENNDFNKATYGLKIQKKLFFQIVDKLSQFFSSSTPNKRSTFPEYVKTIEGIMSFKRFAHTSAKIWEQRLKEYIHLFPNV